uniref:Uncharacterized protein n=1 Tax=Kalanchoe fedtschenkoi TaxID=63787 RepID=A0A7N0SXB6_KALFE
MSFKVNLSRLRSTTFLSESLVLPISATGFDLFFFLLPIPTRNQPQISYSITDQKPQNLSSNPQQNRIGDSISVGYR